MPKVVQKFSNLGNEYDKPDIERLGVFSELRYMNGKGYVPIYPKPTYTKGRNMMGDGPKMRTARQDCYFDKEFKRLFVGEALKGRGRKDKPPRFKNVSERPMMPPTAPKKHSTPGDHYGTFSGKFEAFGNVRRPQPKHVTEKRQCGTSPGKQGGPGYADICINPYPEHKADRFGTKPVYKQYGMNISGCMHRAHYPEPFFDPNPYPDPEKMKQGPVYVKPKEKELTKIVQAGDMIPVGPAKLQGGCHAGCFEEFPEYKPNKYITLYDLMYKPKRHVGGQFYPHSTAQKSYYTKSIITENLRFRINKGNYHTYKPTYIKHLVS